MKLISWGANQYGQLAQAGWPLCEQCESPQLCDTTGLPDGIADEVVEICGGGGHTVLLDSTGRIWACGLNNKGQCGQTPVSTVSPGNSLRPWHQMDTGCLRVVQIAAGWEHTVALTEGGVLIGWGSGSHRQLGPALERGENTSKPVQVAQGVKQMSAGLRHTAWVTEDGKLRSCGSLQGITPINMPEILTAHQVACGQRHTLALLGSEEGSDEEGQVWGWGDNKHGQLGYEVSLMKQTSQIVQAQSLKNLRFTAIKTGWSHAAAISDSGQVVCWGRETYGQLGKSPSSEHKITQPVMWPLWCDKDEIPIKAVQLAVGSEHTLVRLADGGVLSCGWNEHGSCCTGDLSDVHTPQLILKNASLIGCGSAHCFAIVQDFG